MQDDSPLPCNPSRAAVNEQRQFANQARAWPDDWHPPLIDGTGTRAVAMALAEMSIADLEQLYQVSRRWSAAIVYAIRSHPDDNAQMRNSVGAYLRRSTILHNLEAGNHG